MDFYQHQAVDLDGKTRSMSEFKGKVILVVNVASKCGFTPQYTGLEELYKKYKAKGFEILGFPCNQFGAQEPGNAEDIKQFCSLTYPVTFQIFGKVDVNGGNAHPIYQFLKAESPGFLGTEGIKWNFTKFLVDRNGKVIDRFAPMTKPEDLEQQIVTLLG